ncbi:hypothetical protein KC327_g9365 [Hortaea werneckii]|uniref:Uncharacterized protein n=1 Tax=Hortaea werneckii EXF-2000 TaxID=1157616 RepID=A0A1Z5TU25_HORWE|nr:hypothetical protein KC358_g8759 [Hortaea werneckii]OTA39488.1 hypothetical protein BTJ68_00603 [Hortaea werneckii EXF-2000]KAI6933118.1 hypothetical protein KC348_g6833 [Hortaea werneckii]KAI6971532.1 hypothetical protein KC321_g6730 [Hortaea werneckii]KAI7025598.1 hypothetical protein KC366_g12006 [Hortaea werneckii]
MVDTSSRRRSSRDLLGEDELKRMSKQAKELVPGTASSDDSTNKLQSVFALVLSTASFPNVGVTHRVAAWNTLCALMDSCVTCPEPSVRALLWEGHVWQDSLNLYLAQGHLARPKSSRQLLASLTSALRKHDKPAQPLNSEWPIATRLLEGLAVNNDPGKAKTCALALGHFLGKDVLTLSLILNACESYQQRTSVGRKQSKLEYLLYLLFAWLGKGDFGSTIAQVVAAVLDRVVLLRRNSLDGATHGSRHMAWMPAVRHAAWAHDLHMDDLRVHLLPVLFKRSTLEYLVFLTSLGLGYLKGAKDIQTHNADQELLYASLQTGKDLGLLQESSHDQITNLDGTVFLPIKWIGSLLTQNSRSARLTGLSLLITSPTPTKPFTPEILRLIRRSLSHLFADTDANFRGEISGILQRLIDRLRAVSAALARQCQKDSSAQVGLRANEEFLRWLVKFTTWELRPTASYQRHVSALKCLSTISRSGVDSSVPLSHLSKSAVGDTRWAFNIQIMDVRVQRLLLELCCDPFDDVRQMAANVIGMYTTTFDIEDWNRIRQALSQAEEAMLVTGRADRADGVAHLYTLLCSEGGSDVLSKLVDELERMLSIAKRDLAQAVDRYPVHGLLTSIRYILSRRLVISSEPKLPLDRLTTCLHDIWDVVKPTLCNDAPEGYLPEAMLETPDVSTKDTLSYCWRALKEASLLLGALLLIRSDLEEEGQQLHKERFRNLCGLCFTQLAELRHRGAFSTVAQTWTACCMHSDRISEPEHPALREAYDRVILILQNKTTINTRRSAGLPSLICGILVADQTGLLMKKAFKDLEAISREPVLPQNAQEGSLPQVHAMNCMKDVLKNSRLGERSERYVPKALKLAADALRSQAWAVRNCGLMLFRAVMDRLLGTSDAYLEEDAFVQTRLSAQRHPDLLEIVMTLLSAPSEDAASGNEGVFPALQLLQRLEVPQEQYDRTKQSVKALMGSPVWHVRDKSARTYASLVPRCEYPAEMQSLLQTPWASQNSLHGALLCAKYMILSLSAKLEDSEDKHSVLHDCTEAILGAQELYIIDPCPFVKSAYLDLVHALLSTAHDDASTVPTVVTDTSQTPRPGSDIRTYDRVKTDMLHWTCASAANPTAAKVVRPSLAAVYATHIALISEPTSVQRYEIPLMVSELAERDPGAAVTFLETLEKQAAYTGSHHASVLSQVCSAILCKKSAKPAAKMAAIRALLAVQGQDAKHGGLLDIPSGSAMQATSDWANQQHADACLQLQGIRIDRAIGSNSGEQSDLQSELHQWTTSVCEAVKEVGFYSSEAAALALSRVKYLWPAMLKDGHLLSCFASLCFAVYDLLDDDDEDLRLLASSAVSSILDAGANDGSAQEELVPVVASQRLVGFMLQTMSRDQRLIGEAFDRSFGTSSQGFPNVADHLNTFGQIDKALFVEEKQNLYIDEAREVKLWAQVLLRAPADMLTIHLRKQLSAWVSEGLCALTSKMAESGDGPLGWSSRPEVFVLGLQLVYGAEVLLSCVERGTRIYTPASSLRRSLGELKLSIERCNGSGLWLSEIDRILSHSLVVKVRAAMASAAYLQGRYCSEESA